MINIMLIMALIFGCLTLAENSLTVLFLELLLSVKITFILEFHQILELLSGFQTRRLYVLSR